MKPVEGAAIPAGNTVGDVMIYADEQTGALDRANDRIVNGHETIRRCEERDEKAVKRASKGFWGRLFD